MLRTHTSVVPLVSRNPLVKLRFGWTTFLLLLLVPAHALILYTDRPEFVLLYAAAIVGLFSVSFYSRHIGNSWIFVCLIFTAICVQNIYFGFFLNFGQPPSLVPGLFLIETKTVLIFGEFLLTSVFLMSRVPWSRWDAGSYGVICFAALIMLSFAVSPAPIFSKVGYIRTFLTPVVMWYIGRFTIRKENDFNQVVGVLLTVGVLLSLVSGLELANRALWNDYLQMDTLLELKGPTADTTDFFGLILKRLFTGVGSPINGAFIFALLFLLALFLKRNMLASIFAAQVVLTFAKAGAIVAIIGTAIYIFRDRFVKVASWTRAFWLIPIFLLLIVFYLSFVNVGLYEITDISETISTNTAAEHLRGLFAGIMQMPSAPLGHGLGVGGNITQLGSLTGIADARDDDDPRFQTGGESTVGVLLYQLGALGLVAFGLWCFSRLRELFGYFRRLRQAYPRYSEISLAMFAAMLGALMAAFVTESALVPQTGGVIFLVSGLICGLCAHLETRRNSGRETELT